MTVSERVVDRRRSGDRAEAPGSVQAQARRIFHYAVAHPVLTAFLVALVLRLAVSGVIAVRYGGALFGDESTYSAMALAKATGRASSWDSYTIQLFNSTATFLWPLTAVSWLSGNSGFAGQAYVALLGAVTALLTALLLRPVSQVLALGAGLFVALLPSQILWSSLTLKDAAVWVALVGLAVLVRNISTGDVRGAAIAGAGAVVGLYLLGHLRDHTMIIAGWSAALALGALPGRFRARRFLLAVAAALAMPAFLGFGVGGTFLVGNASHLGEKRAINAEDAQTALVTPLDSDAATSVKVQKGAALRSNAADIAVEHARTAAAEAANAVAVTAQLEREALARVSAARSRPEREAALGAMRAIASKAAAQREAAQVRLFALRDQLAREEQLRSQRHTELEQATSAADAAAKRAQRPGVDQSFGGGYTLPAEGLAANARYLPKGLAVMLLWPYPWNGAGNARLQLARVDSLLWYPGLALGVIGLGSLWRQRTYLLFPLLVGGGSVLASALSQGNFGTAYRHRGEFVWVVAALASFGALTLWERVARARAEVAT